MSFAKHSDAVPVDGAADGNKYHEQFCAELADGMHALAQPLTILRSAIGMLTLPNDAGIDRKRYLDLSERQIDRTCNLFTSIQNLLAVKMEPVARASVSHAKMLDRIIEDLSTTLQEMGIGVVVLAPESLPAIYCDPQRTEQAIASVMRAALSIFSRGDVIEISASRRDDGFEFMVRSADKQKSRLDSSARLYLSLAKANIESQQGKYEFTESPFTVSLALPLLSFEQNCSD
jgi:signal transduction histidine kinase